MLNIFFFSSQSILPQCQGAVTKTIFNCCIFEFIAFCWKIFIAYLLIEGGGSSGLEESDENPSNFTDLTYLFGIMQGGSYPL